MKQILTIIAFWIAMSAQAQTVKIAAAADLRYAMDEVVKAFKKSNSGANIEVIYGSSGNAFTQISNGAPFDLYFSADIVYPQKLKEAGLTLTDTKLYAIGRIVLWSASLDVSKGLSVLAEKPKIKIATANPEHAPYGQRSVEALKFYRLYESVEKQLIYGENISQAAQFCLSGNAEAGLIALSLALSPFMSNQGKYFLIDDKSHRPLEQAYVILNHAKGNKSAFSFAEFISSTAARVIFEKYGFTLPK
ncbi:MAG: molybdate ABC transporter substrate-binding protein [Bacteroidota bacterium]|nr:molybdate ABC transporter substrate-binding protein [Bacteroidota bacterium]MDO9615281.1 molybdate ABC transporter substrate-binding protein [Bacteroidota bacterium]